MKCIVQRLVSGGGLGVVSGRYGRLSQVVHMSTGKKRTSVRVPVTSVTLLLHYNN